MNTKRYKRILLAVFLVFGLRGVAAASGPFGPPQPLSREAGGLHTGIGYWYQEDTYTADKEYGTRQQHLYSEAGYGGAGNLWDVYARIGISDLRLADAFSPSSAATTTRKNEFEENTNFFGTAGVKGFYPFDRTFGVGAFLQGTYYFRDATDAVEGSRNGVPFSLEMRIRDHWDLNFGLGLQAIVPGGIKLYLGPFLTYAEARVAPSTTVAGLPLAAGETTLQNKTDWGGFAGIELPLAKGFRLHLEGQYSARFSAGTSVTYSY